MLAVTKNIKDAKKAWLPDTSASQVVGTGALPGELYSTVGENDGRDTVGDLVGFITGL
jgi:hypothetical protein